MTEYYRIMTENDEEGRTQRTVGIFRGGTDQIAAYLTVNNIKPYYHFFVENISIIDVTNQDVKMLESVEVNKYSGLNIKIKPEYEAEVTRMRALATIRSKLTREERELLGL